METKTKILIQLLLLCVGICIGMMLTRLCNKQQEIVTEVTTKDSTVVKVDTNKVFNPKPISIIITGKYFTPFVVRQFIADTVFVRDTIYLGGKTFYQEIKEYKDSTYYAKISGINAYLEEIKVYPRTEYKYIYKTEKVTEKPKKWGIGPQVGFGLLGDHIQPYIGIGVQYNLMSF